MLSYIVHNDNVSLYFLIEREDVFLKLMNELFPFKLFINIIIILNIIICIIIFF